jgi:predicted patatin/cPLA2 family phospholipase
MMRALVVEGGGMRTIFGAGVLDAFEQEQFGDFDLFIGVSAGASLLSSFIAEQASRNLMVMANSAINTSYMSARRFLMGGDYFDFNTLWEMNEKVNKLNVEKGLRNLSKNNSKFWIMATDVDTGIATTIEPELDDWGQCLQASSALPFFVKNPLELRGQRFLDGGVVAPIPIQQAIEAGASEIIVLRSRPSDYRKHAGFEQRFIAAILSKYPALAKLILQRADRYNEAIGLIHSPPKGVIIHEIAPETPLKCSRTCTDTNSILSDHLSGFKAGQGFLMNGQCEKLPTHRPA